MRNPSDIKTSTPYIGFLFFVYTLLAFPLFYFVYKFGDPEPIAHDFFQYYRLYKDWDIDNVNAPFNMRLAGSAVVHLFYKAGFFYDTPIAFDKYFTWGFDKRVFFCACFFNYLCVIATCVQIFYTLKKLIGGTLLSFCGSLLFLLGFGTIFYDLMPLTDAFSVLLFSITLHHYLRRSYLSLIPLFLSVFQREYILLAFILIAFLDYFYYSEKRFFLVLFLGSVFSFSVYFFLRKTLFHTEALAYQTSISGLFHSLLHFKFPGIVYLKQAFLTLNLFILYISVILLKLNRRLKIDRYGFLKLSLLFLQINGICLVAELGTNMGRYFYVLVPLIIYQTIQESKVLLTGVELNPQR